jgi:hypothetical protein
MVLLEAGQLGGVISGKTQGTIGENTFGIDNVDEDFFDGPLAFSATSCELFWGLRKNKVLHCLNTVQ